MTNLKNLFCIFLLVTISLLALLLTFMNRGNDKVANTPKLMKPPEALSQPESKVLYKLLINWNESSAGKESYRLHCDFQNHSDKPVVILKCGFGSNHSMILENEFGQEPPLKEQGRYEKSLFENWPNRDQTIPVTVYPGNSNRYTIDVANFYDLKPGKYRLKVRFRDQVVSSDRFTGKKQASFMIDIVSNELLFEVKK